MFRTIIVAQLQENGFLKGEFPLLQRKNNPKVKYNTPGWKKITLITSNSNGSDTFSQMNYVKIFPISVMENSFIQDFEVEKKEDLDSGI